MEVVVQLKKDELREHYEALRPSSPRRDFYLLPVRVAFWTVAAILYLVLFGPIDHSHVALFIVMLVVGAIDQYLSSRRGLRQVIEDESNPVLKVTRYHIDESGVSYSNDCSEGRISWAAVCKVDETTALFRLFISSFEAIVIPKRVLDSETQFREDIKAWRGAA